MKFFSTRHLVDKSIPMSPCEPWTFTPASRPGDRICLDKEERQIWYRRKDTEWNFYTGIEPANDVQRCSKENPPKFIHALAADYDVKISDERIDEAIQSMEIRPVWVERSLGGNCRLIWILPRPLQVESMDFSIWILQAAKKWLHLDLLPGLDVSAWENPTRLFCNGAVWRKVDNSGPINENKLQAFFVETAKKFKFRAPEGNEIPLEVVEKTIRDKYPGFSWPTAFEENSQGPSFWIVDSTSPLSAIVKKDGMLTFSAHAAKPFYPWSDILGKEFVKEINEESITRATLDVFHDGQSYWRKIDGVYQSVSESAMKIYLKKGCGIPEKKIEDTLFHLHENSRVVGAAPFVFREPGLIEYNCRKVLNTWRNNVMKPAESSEGLEKTWVWYFLNNLFDPPEQLVWVLAWWKHYYLSGFELTPRPGQNIYLLGKAGKGKTFFCRQLVGKTVGGFVDASRYIVDGDAFGSENYHVPLWCIDDSSPGNSTNAHDRFSAMMKKTAANQEFKVNEKFRVPVTVEWAGRISVTANIDFVSSRILSSLDNTSADKTSVFKCTDADIHFPERYELQRTLTIELPLLCRYLIDWEVPDIVPRDGRFGYAPHHNQFLLDQTHQTSRAAPLKEILIEELRAYFIANPEATEWRGSLTALVRLLQSNAWNDYFMKSFKPETFNRYLELIEREGIIKCRTETGENKIRIWIFPKL